MNAADGVDEMYLDITAEAEHMLTGQTSAEFSALLETVNSYSLLAGDDCAEARLKKEDIRRGHAGTSSAISGDTRGEPADWYLRPLERWSAEDR
jgi:hypothetical protein